MAHKNIEIEIQVSVENIKPLLDFLGKEGDFKYEKRQIDEYFTPKENDYTAVRPINEWLRLRDAEGKYSINYKNWYDEKNGRSIHCDEHETEIKDIAQMKKVLLALNFRSLIVVDKLRRIYNYQDFEVAIDKVKGLEDSVEIEYIGQDEKAVPKEVGASMIDFLKKIGVGKIKENYQGYPFLLLFPEEAKWEEI
ncbi:MAG: class IV adenylate cyclase [Patescibacteria group bacterium]